MKLIIPSLFFEFDDGSEWTLFKCLTHANRTSNLIYKLMYFIRSGVQVSKIYFGYLKVRYKYLITIKEIIISLWEDNKYNG